MPISGYVLRLESEGVDAALNSVRSLDGVEVGDMVSGGWPVVTETNHRKVSEKLAERIEAMPGVLGLTLVYHNFEDQSGAEEKDTDER